MARRTSANREQLVADWMTGEFSQRDLAAKYKIGTGTANLWVKGIPRKNERLVDKIVTSKQELANLSELEALSVLNVVEQRTRNVQFFASCAIKNVQDAMAHACNDQLDFKHRADTISKGKDVVLGKDPEVAVQINNYRSLDEVPTSELLDMAIEK